MTEPFQKLTTYYCEAEFYWNLGKYYILDHQDDYYIWFPGRYGGDNTIIYIPMTFLDEVKSVFGPHFRYKGKHVIEEYCGTTSTIVYNLTLSEILRKIK